MKERKKAWTKERKEERKNGRTKKERTKVRKNERKKEGKTEIRRERTWGKERKK